MPPRAKAIGPGLDEQTEHDFLVYDPGGGDFGVSPPSIDNSVFGVVTPSGDIHFGGDDFDQRLDASSNELK